MIPRAALWAPATTPLEEERTRARLRPRAFAIGLIGVAVIASALWLATREAPQFVVGVALLAAVTVDAVTVRLGMRTVAVEVSAPRLVTTSDPLVCTVHATGVSRPVVVSPSARPTVQRFLLEPGVPGMIVLAPRRRGVLHTMLFDVTMTGPLGLVQCARRLRVRLTPSVEVGPTPLPHDIAWPRPRADAFGLTESAPIGDELYRTARPYVRGDSLRRVHWKASAHHGALMVKESDGTGIVAVRVVVQLDAPGAASEVALSRAAWVAEQCAARGWRTELVTVRPRGVPSAPPAPLGSPFGPPPLDTSATVGPVEAVARPVRSRADALSVLALAAYGPVPVGRGPGLTCVVTADGDRWR